MADERVVDLTNVKKTSMGMDLLLYSVTLVLYVGIGWYLEYQNGRMDSGILFFTFYLTVLGFVAAKIMKHPCWRTMLISTLLNIVLVEVVKIIHLPLFYNDDSKPVTSFTFTVGFTIMFLVALGITRKYYANIAEQNRNYIIKEQLLRVEKSIGDMDTIPEAKFVPFKISEKDIMDKCSLDSIIAKYATTEEDKKWLYQMITSKQESFMVDMDKRYMYLSTVEELINSINCLQRNENEEWVIEEAEVIRKNYAHAFKNYAHAFGLTEYPYKFSDVMDKLDDRVQKELAKPYEWLYARENSVKQSLSDFISDVISTSIGYHGEAKVEKMLVEYSDQIILIPNLRVEVDGESIENDFIILAPQGIFVLEVKNLGTGGSYGLHIAKDGRWSKTYKSKQTAMDSPTGQNERHILYLERLINNTLGRTMDNRLSIQGMVVLANDKVDIHNESDQSVIRYSEIMRKIKQYPTVMKEEELHELKKLLESNRLPVKPYEMKNHMQKFFFEGIRLKEDYKNFYTSAKPLMEYAGKYKKDMWEVKIQRYL